MKFFKLKKAVDKDALDKWNLFTRNFEKSGDVNFRENESQKQHRINALLDDFTQFAPYYFPKVTKSEFAKWHKKYVRYVSENDTCYAVIMVSRDMAKSSVTALLVIWLYFRGEFKSLGLFAHIQTQAEGLLAPIKAAFEKNERLIYDFGSQVGFGNWTANKFVTIKGVSFRAIGAGQNPRGEKNEDADRFDILIFDDFDDPEVCRNPDRLDNHWKYVLGDCIPALHVSGKRRIIFLNNKIDEDCIIQRAWDHAEAIKDVMQVKPLCIKINLVDDAGKSNWPEAYTDAQCAEMIALAGMEADTEYKNNPLRKGKVFKKEWFQFKKLPPLNSYRYLLAYHDGGFKKSKTSDTKSLILMGMHEQDFHIHRVYVGNASINEAIDWHYDVDMRLKAANATCPFYMEEKFLLDLLYDHFAKRAEHHGYALPIIGDKRDKPDKDLRIMNTAGYFERGRVYFDESLQNDHHFLRLQEQYLKFRVGGNYHKDGPDAVEGAMFLLRAMLISIGDIKTLKRTLNKHRV